MIILDSYQLYIFNNYLIYLIGAYNPLDSSNSKLIVPSGIGLLSSIVNEIGIPIHENLLTPKYPIWILHAVTKTYNLL